MKLEKFNKNKKQKEIIIGAILILIGVIGGIGLYRSFAMYEEKQTFDVLKGTVPDFRIGKGDVNFIALTVNGKKTSKVPLKVDYTDIKVDCDNDTTGEWDTERWVLVTDIKEIPTSCTVDFIFEEQIFDYIGDEQTFTAPINGRYKLEVWGAEGGTAQVTYGKGGYGGYATGEIFLEQGEILYIYVGQQGFTLSKVVSSPSAQTYNGGGSAFGSDGLGVYGESYGTGGGATHIATESGLLSTLENNVDALLIAAGGGSGYIGNKRLYNKEMYCYNCETSIETDIKTSTTESVSSNPVSQSAKQGNGYAKITYLGSN